MNRHKTDIRKIHIVKIDNIPHYCRKSSEQWCLALLDTKTTKIPPSGGGKNRWKRIRHLMRRYQTPIKGYSAKNMATVQLLKLKHKVVASATDKRRMTRISREFLDCPNLSKNRLWPSLSCRQNIKLLTCHRDRIRSARGTAPASRMFFTRGS